MKIKDKLQQIIKQVIKETIEAPEPRDPMEEFREILSTEKNSLKLLTYVNQLMEQYPERGEIIFDYFKAHKPSLAVAAPYLKALASQPGAEVSWNKTLMENAFKIEYDASFSDDVKVKHVFGPNSLLTKIVYLDRDAFPGRVTPKSNMTKQWSLSETNPETVIAMTNNTLDKMHKSMSQVWDRNDSRAASLKGVGELPPVETEYV